MKANRYYHGKGQAQKEGWRRLPEIDPEVLRRPSGYLATPELAAAVDVALTLGMPLLLTGEPGSGKSRLAHSLAWELGLGEQVLEFVVKSDTQGRDLFYSFDTVGRFHAAHTKGGDAGSCHFISFNALGKAILHARPKSYALDELGLLEGRVGHPGEPRRSVVLIDEIDKAPRDVPNDILAEIEAMSFRIPELDAERGRELVISLKGDKNPSQEGEGPDPGAHNRYRPIVIITSNSEKALPDAFLRRCVYFHLPFPPFEKELERSKKDNAAEGDVVTVERIVRQRLGDRFADKDKTGAPDPLSEFAHDCLNLFSYLREPRHGLEKRPSLAELLNWLQYLARVAGPAEWPKRLRDLDPDRLAHSVNVTLFKKERDQRRAPALIEEWRKTVRDSR